MKTLSKVIEFPINYHINTNVTITKKYTKNMRLVVTKTGEVKLSIPNYVTYNYAYQFLTRKRKWLNVQLTKIMSNLQKDKCNFINNGNIFLLGRNYPLQIEISTKNKIIFNNTTLDNTQTQININDCGFIIYIKDQNVDIKNLFIKWCKKYFLDFFTNRLNYIYSQMFKNTTPPVVKIKTMKSMWGNCNFVKKIVTLNLYLAKADISCIDYVIVHELAHLIHHDHSKDFHNLMTTLMPDWKARKKMLNNYSLSF